MTLSINQSNRLRYALNMVMDRIMPQGYDKTDDGSEVDTLEKISAIFVETGRIKVWTGASDNTVFRSAASNHDFRAWHDRYHILHQLPFTPEGELAVLEYQLKDLRECVLPSTYRDEVEAIIKAEVAGQLEYEKKYGVFPEDQMGFIAEYISNKTTALAGGKYHRQRRG